MKNTFKQTLLNIVGSELEQIGFNLISTNGYPVYHRRTDELIEIIQFSKAKYETYITVGIATVYLNNSKEFSNISYPAFNEFSDGDLNKITVDDCIKKHYLKGNIGNAFHFGNIYFVLGMGIMGISDNTKKPFGIRLKKYKDTTFVNVCELINKKLKKYFEMVEIKKC